MVLPTAGQPVLALPVGDEWHVVALVDVREVLAVPTVTPLPDAPGWLAGLVNVRGEILPAVDTAAAAGSAPTIASHAVVVATDAGPAALLASGPPESTVLGTPCGDGAGIVAGRFALDDRVGSALDLAAVLHAGPAS